MDREGDCRRQDLRRPHDTRMTSTVAARPEADTDSAAARRSSSPVVRQANYAHVASLILGGLLLLFVNRTQWFFGDDWEFVVSRGFDDPTFGLLHPHNEHWSTLPILVYRALLNVFGLHTYLPFVAVLIAVHLALTHVLWRCCLRVGAPAMVATALSAAFLVVGAGAENLLWAFQMGFVGSVLFGYLMILVTDTNRWSAVRLVGAWGLGLLALMCSTIGVVMVVVAALTALLRRGIRTAVLVASVPAAAFLAWYLSYGTRAASPTPRSIGTLLMIPEYTAFGITSALTNFVGVPGMGTILAVALSVLLLWAGRTATSSRAIAYSASLGAIALFVLVGVGRSGFGAEEAGPARYAYLALALLLPGLSLLASWAVEATPWPTVVTVVVGLVLVAYNLSELRAAVSAEREREDAIKRRVLAAAEIASAGEPVLRQQPDPALNPDITMEALARFNKDGWLPADVPATEEEEKDELDVRAQVQIALRPDAGTDIPSASISSVTGATVTTQGSCAQIDPTGIRPEVILDLDPRQGGSARVTSSTDGTLDVALASRSSASVEGDATTFPVIAGQAVLLEIVAPGVQAVLTLPEGPALLCFDTAGA